jgi:hypothetical protein
LRSVAATTDIGAVAQLWIHILDAPCNFSFLLCLYSMCMEVLEMLKKSLAALFGLAFAMALLTPPKANAEVIVGVGVAARPGYGYVVARPHPYAYIAPAPYVAYEPGYFYPSYRYPAHVVVRHEYARHYDYRYAEPRGYGWRR